MLIFLSCIYVSSVNVTYIDKDGKKHPVKGKLGDNLMYLAHRHEIEMEGQLEISLYFILMPLN
jgi:hypothetical protein